MEDVYLPDGTVGKHRVSSSAAMQHSAAVYIDHRPMAFTNVERVKSARDRRGKYMYAAAKYGVECILGKRGARYYVLGVALCEAVRTIERERVHFIPFHREPFSDSQSSFGACMTLVMV